MGIFSRVSDIIAANVNALIDKAEDPEKMIAQVIREMETGMGNAKRYAATALAAERRLGRELDQNRMEADRWKGKAREALAVGREDLARRALLRKKEHDDLVKGLEGQHAAARHTADQVKTSIRALDARLAEARRKQRTLLARHRAAKVRLELRQATWADPGTAFAKFDRLENRLIDQEDELAALNELNHAPNGLEESFADIEQREEIEKELEALKKETTVQFA